MNIAFAVVKHIALGGGIERYTAELGARLVRRGHAVRVYTMRSYGPAPRWHEGMRIVRLPCIPLTSCEKLSASILGVLHAALSPWADIVHLHSIAPGAMGWFARLCHKPTVLQFHGVEWQRARWSPLGSAVLHALERCSVRVNGHFTAVSRAQCDYYRRTYGIEARYIPGGAVVEPPVEPRELATLGLVPGHYALFAARLVREKGAHYLIEAFRRLDTRAKLVIAGDVRGADAYRQELHRLAGGDGRIVWPGFVQGRLREELFSHARVLVQPSDVEGLSIGVLEAMGRGTCCLVSDIPENVEAVGADGITFRRGDVGDLAAKLGDILDGRDTDAGRGARTMARVRDEYSWDRIADAFERYYREVAAGRGVSAPRADGNTERG
jgi:glycosyltransferase involved in cell wall biosynthesis